MNIFKYVAPGIVLAGLLSSTAFAGNVTLGFLDPCVKPTEQLSEQSRDWNATVSQASASIATAEPDERFNAAWWDAQKKVQHDAFMKERGPRLDIAKMDKETAFESWFTEEKANTNPEELKMLITEDYRAALKAKLAEERAPVDKQLDEAKRDLGSSCKKDVGSQVLRSALNVTMAPFHIIGGNIKGMVNEPGAIAKGIRATTGVSVEAIKEHGVFGGPNSVFRKPFG